MIKRILENKLKYTSLHLVLSSEFILQRNNNSSFTLVVGCVGGRPVVVGMLCSAEKVGARLFVKWVCGGVDMMESGVSGVGGEYADCETAGTWWAVVTPPETMAEKARVREGYA